MFAAQLPAPRRRSLAAPFPAWDLPAACLRLVLPKMPGPGLSRWFATRRRRDIPTSCPRRSRAGNPGTLEQPSTSAATLAASPERRFLPADHRHDRRSRRRNWGHCAACRRCVSAVATTFFASSAGCVSSISGKGSDFNGLAGAAAGKQKTQLQKTGSFYPRAHLPSPLGRISEPNRTRASGKCSAPKQKKRGRSLAFITASLPFD